MPLSTLTYAPPIRRSKRTSQLDYELLESAAELANEGRSKESLHKVFEHLFPEATIVDLSQQPFTFTQGSSKVTARVESDELVVTVPLVRVPSGGGAVAALRYVLTKISGSGQLHQPRLHGDELQLEFRDQLSRLHPAKVLEVLRRMPAAADNNDDWLIGQFSATPLDRGSVVALSEDELTRAEALWRAHWSDIDELLKESQRKRSFFFLNELTAYALYRIRFALPLCGFLSAKLSESASTFNDNQEDPLKRETALAKCVKEMAQASRAELEKSLGHVDYAISPFANGTPAQLTSFFGPCNYMETIEKLKGSDKPLDAALALIGTYSYLLACFAWPEPVEAALNGGLALASGKPWREAANTLWDHARGLVAAFAAGSDDDDDDDDDDADGDEADDGGTNEQGGE